MPTEHSDEAILAGLKSHDSDITRQYFYGYCRMAYHIYNRRYDLVHKPGMDFYTLAHEYYLSLDKHQWRQMEDRKPGTSLKTWMTNGFRFIVLDRMKQSAKERQTTTVDERSSQARLRFDIGDDHFVEDVRRTVEEIANLYYSRDSKASIILKMLLVDGFKGKDVAQQLGMTPSAVSQRYKKMMNEVVAPYFRRYYTPPIVARCFSLYSPDVGSATAMPNDARYAAPRHYANNDTHMIMKRRTTPDTISTLQPGEVFVFGSNLAGMHGGGAARFAHLHFGAVMGQGVGRQGQSYAIPTMQGGVQTIAPYVDEFIDYARAHPDDTFLVTSIGCGIAGFSPDEIAPLFRRAVDVDNIFLPADFWHELI